MTDELIFELEIVALGDNEYQAQVRAMPVIWEDDVSPIVTFRLPYSEPELEAIVATLNGTRHMLLSAREDTAVKFGYALFDRIFVDRILFAYQESVKRAVESEKSLTLRLVLDDAGELQNLPWEFLHNGNDFVAMSTSTPIVRYPKQEVERFKVKIIAPIRLLVMIASPPDMPPLNVVEERANLERATEKLREQGQLEIEFLEDATLIDLQRLLREKDFHIFHYIGHSGYNKKTGQGWLALLDRFRESHELVKGDDLARELSEENTIRLVVLNSCHGAQSDSFNPAGGIANSLVTRGIPAVVANQFEVSNEAATIFASEFYDSVAIDLPLDAAVSEARRAVRGSLRNLEWATPVLYLRTNDGALFDTRELPIVQLDAQSEPNVPRLIGVASAAIITTIIVILVILSVFGSDDEPINDNPDVDLRVSSITPSTGRPAPGEFVSIRIEVENLSENESPETDIVFLGNDTDDDTAVRAVVPSIEPNGIATIEIPYRFNWFGSFIATAFLDPEEELNDTNRDNNVSSFPVITDSNDPFVINFSDALPDGSLVTEPRPIPSDTFLLWGFTLSTDTRDRSVECIEAVPWFKIEEDSSVTVGTGLPDDPETCTNEPLVVVLKAQQDRTQEGVSGITAIIHPSLTANTLIAYNDRELEREFARDEILGNNRDQQIANLQLGFFDRINLFAAEILTQDGDLEIVELQFDPPN